MRRSSGVVVPNACVLGPLRAGLGTPHPVLAAAEIDPGDRGAAGGPSGILHRSAPGSKGRGPSWLS